MTDCLGQISNPICDSHVEEDCTYNGDNLVNMDEGSAGQPSDCQLACVNLGCQYWIHNTSRASCILKRDGRKTCNILGGPKTPSYQQCKKYFFK